MFMRGYFTCRNGLVGIDGCNYLERIGNDVVLKMRHKSDRNGLVVDNVNFKFSLVQLALLLINFHVNR